MGHQGRQEDDCDSCTWYLKVVPDRHPREELDTLERVAGLQPRSSYPMMFRGWVVQKNDAEGGFTWVNIDTLGRVPMDPIKFQRDWLEYIATDAVSFAPLPDEKESTHSARRVFDPWTGEYGTFADSTTSSRGPLGLGVEVVQSKDGGLIRLAGEDGSLLGQPIDAQLSPGKEVTYIESVRTRFGVVSEFMWSDDSSSSYESTRDSGVTIVMHR